MFFFFLSIFRGISFLQNPRARRRGNGFESLSVQIHHLHAQMSIERHFIACAVSHSLHLQSDISNISFVLLTSRMSKRFRSNSAFCKTKSREKKKYSCKNKKLFLRVNVMQMWYCRMSHGGQRAHKKSESSAKHTLIKSTHGYDSDTKAGFF